MGNLTMMNIPEKISVGFRERSDTYTGKLAYVVYTDAKGVLRKATSWNGWRDRAIPPEEYKNEPTSGFVLNKGVGGVRDSYGWNPRNEYIRVYDPRGFEFEISVANLLFILQECTSVKGKGLEGEFVYAWDKKDLVLLPVQSNEYKKCSEFTQNQTRKVTKKDMVEGHTYRMKNNVNVMYLGRHDYYELDYTWKGGGRTFTSGHKGKRHFFLNLDTSEKGNNPSYIIQPGFTSLAIKTSSGVCNSFAEEYIKLIESSYTNPVTQVEEISSPILKKDLTSINSWAGLKRIVKTEEAGFCVASIYKKEDQYQIKLGDSVSVGGLSEGRLFIPDSPRADPFRFESFQEGDLFSAEDLLKKEFYELQFKTDTGAIIPTYIY